MEIMELPLEGLVGLAVIMAAVEMAEVASTLGVIYLQWEEKEEKLASMIEVEREVEALWKFLAFPIDNFLMVHGYGIKVEAVMGLHQVPQTIPQKKRTEHLAYF
jgi:hypothetical protein